MFYEYYLDSCVCAAYEVSVFFVFSAFACVFVCVYFAKSREESFCIIMLLLDYIVDLYSIEKIYA